MIPDKSMVVVVTSAGSKMESLLKVIYDSLIFDRSTSLFDVKNEYIFQPKCNEIKFLKAVFEKNHINIITEREEKEKEILLIQKSGKYQGITRFVKDIQFHDQSYCSRIMEESENRLFIRIWYTETPYVVDYIFTRCNQEVELEYRINAGFTMKNFRTRGIVNYA